MNVLVKLFRDEKGRLMIKNQDSTKIFHTKLFSHQVFITVSLHAISQDIAKNKALKQRGELLVMRPIQSTQLLS